MYRYQKGQSHDSTGSLGPRHFGLRLVWKGIQVFNRAGKSRPYLLPPLQAVAAHHDRPCFLEHLLSAGLKQTETGPGTCSADLCAVSGRTNWELERALVLVG